MSALGHYRVGDTLSPNDTAEVRDIVNHLISGALRQGPAQSVTLRSCHDLGSHGRGPRHVSGIRVFDVMIAVKQPFSCGALVRLVADEPGSDHIRLPIDVGLGIGADIEHLLGGVEGVAGDLEGHAPSRADLQEHREVLAATVVHGNARIDQIRTLAAQPAAWPPISKLAPLRAVLVELHPYRDGADTCGDMGE